MVGEKVIKSSLAIDILNIFICFFELLNPSSPLFTLILTPSKLFSGFQAYVSLFSCAQLSFSKIQDSWAFSEHNTLHHGFLGT